MRRSSRAHLPGGRRSVDVLLQSLHRALPDIRESQVPPCLVAPRMTRLPCHTAVLDQLLVLDAPDFLPAIHPSLPYSSLKAWIINYKCSRGACSQIRDALVQSTEHIQGQWFRYITISFLSCFLAPSRARWLQYRFSNHLFVIVTRVY